MELFRVLAHKTSQHVFIWSCTSHIESSDVHSTAVPQLENCFSNTGYHSHLGLGIVCSEDQSVSKADSWVDQAEEPTHARRGRQRSQPPTCYPLQRKRFLLLKYCNGFEGCFSNLQTFLLVRRPVRPLTRLGTVQGLATVSATLQCVK